MDNDEAYLALLEPISKLEAFQLSVDLTNVITPIMESMIADLDGDRSGRIKHLQASVDALKELRNKFNAVLGDLANG